ncbi:hypothetical protein DMC30DRAFT_127163 [Rhodotorula diobovata]|uniref:Uncharacterized protein n=1 Tax=Rhodotorula diobovata TaxID=5288 RepID=A0A5C5FMZ6_9BASI|nr:hypothetical protein DMC30DRAFT_127163 [Rhodotorula diobovata]
MHHDPEIPAIVAAHVAHDSPSAGWAWPADWTRIDDPRHTPESREAAHAYLAAVQRKKAADFALARIRAAASSLSGTGVKRMANASTSKAPTASRAKAQRRLTGPNHSLLRGLNASSSSSAKGKEKASEWTPGGLSSTTRRHRNSLELLKMFLAEREGVSPLEAARRWLVPGCRAQLARDDYKGFVFWFVRDRVARQDAGRHSRLRATHARDHPAAALRGPRCAVRARRSSARRAA